MLYSHIYSNSNYLTDRALCYGARKLCWVFWRVGA